MTHGLDILFFWSTLELMNTVIGKPITNAIELSNKTSFHLHHARIPDIRSPVSFRLSITRNLTLSDEYLTSYFSRFVIYPLHARFQRATVYHILDDYVGNLVQVLDPKRCVVTFNHAVPSILEEYYAVPADGNAMKVFRAIFNSILKARFIVAASQHVRAIILNEYDTSPDRVVYNPYGHGAAFCPRAPDVRLRLRSELGIAPEAFVLLNVGTNAPVKNIEIVLKALTLLPTHFHFLRIGDDWTTSQKAIIEKCALSSRVHHLPQQEHDRVADLYAVADLFVHPSLFEGFGLTLVEAMASGIPLVTSGHGTMAEVAGDAAVLVDPRQHEELAANIMMLSNNPSRLDQLREAGLKRAGDFSWHRHAETLSALYETIGNETQ